LEEEVIVNEQPVASCAVDAVQLELEIEGVRTHELAQGRFVHFRHIFEPHMPRNRFDDLFNLFGRQFESTKNLFGHIGAFFVVPVEAQTVFGLKGGVRFADVVQEDGVGQRSVWIVHEVEHEHGVFKDIAFGMIFRRLFLSDHGKRFGNDVLHKTEIDEVAQRVTGLDAFNECAGKFVFDPLDADFGEIGGVGLNRRAEVDAVGAASVLIARIFAEGGDFGFDAVLNDHDDAESFADRDGLIEKLFDLLGQGVGGDVVVFGGSVQQFVAHGSAGKQCGETRRADLLQDAQCVIVRVFHLAGEFEGKSQEIKS